MPTYEYECASCGNRFEIFQSIKAEPLKECPKCHAKIYRLISQGAGIIFKGKGFYETDYKRKGVPRPSEKSDVGPCPSSSKNNPACKTCDLKKEN